MAESAQMLKRKAGELATAVDEAQDELARADRNRRTEWHARLTEAVRAAREWLGSPEAQSEDDAAAAAAARTAEGHLHEIRMRRHET